MNQSCQNCRFAKPIGDTSRLTCVRFPPTIVAVGSYGNPEPQLPEVPRDFWCGEWQENPPESGPQRATPASVHQIEAQRKQAESFCVGHAMDHDNQRCRVCGKSIKEIEMERKAL